MSAPLPARPFARFLEIDRRFHGFFLFGQFLELLLVLLLWLPLVLLLLLLLLFPLPLLLLLLLVLSFFSRPFVASAVLLDNLFILLLHLFRHSDHALDYRLSWCGWSVGFWLDWFFVGLVGW